MTEKLHYYFVGIGGAGMSGIARVFLELGYKVSGSDLNYSESTRRLEQLGATIYQGHRETNLQPDVDALVVSSAIPKDNPELVKAQSLGIPIYHRADMLGRLMLRQKGIAVAGAHGKTTTTSMISLVFEKNGLDPTVVIGGELTDIGGNAKLGRGQYLVAEADESDGSFLKLHPFISVVTNIEDDHLDHYGTRENIEAAFLEFLNLTNQEGMAVLCLDDPVVKKLLLKVTKRIVTYGLQPGADYTAQNLELAGLGSSAEVLYRGEVLGKLVLSVPGRHNVQNALAAIAVAMEAGLKFKDIADALCDFKGAQRRFQKVGEVRGVQIYDDYAHHPTELKATIAAARTLRPGRVVAVFQPHRYSRTHFLYREFGSAFKDADLLLVNEIYPAGEQPIPGVDAGLIVEQVRTQTNQPTEYIKDKAALVERLAEIAQPGDLVITLGAGNIWTVGLDLYQKLSART